MLHPLVTEEVPWLEGLEAHGAHHPLGLSCPFLYPKSPAKSIILGGSRPSTTRRRDTIANHREPRRESNSSQTKEDSKRARW